MILDTAIMWQKNCDYDITLKSDHVKDIVAWSIYLTWQEVEQARIRQKVRNKE